MNFPHTSLLNHFISVQNQCTIRPYSDFQPKSNFKPSQIGCGWFFCSLNRLKPPSGGPFRWHLVLYSLWAAPNAPTITNYITLHNRLKLQVMHREKCHYPSRRYDVTHYKIHWTTLPLWRHSYSNLSDGSLRWPNLNRAISHRDTCYNHVDSPA